MALIEGVVSRLKAMSNGALTGVRVTELGSMAVDPVKPPLGELARAGAGFAAVVGNGATFKAPITAMPTTTATWILYNGSTAGKSYLIDSIGCFLASGTAAVGATLLAGVTLGQQQSSGSPPSAFASTVVSNLSGKSNDSGAVLANAWTIVGGTPAWHGVAAAGSLTATTTIGQGLIARVNGRYCIPPGFGLVMDVLSGTGTSALYGVYVTFDALVLDRE